MTRVTQMRVSAFASHYKKKDRKKPKKNAKKMQKKIQKNAKKSQKKAEKGEKENGTVLGSLEDFIVCHKWGA